MHDLAVDRATDRCRISVVAEERGNRAELAGGTLRDPVEVARRDTRPNRVPQPVERQRDDAPRLPHQVQFPLGPQIDRHPNSSLITSIPTICLLLAAMLAMQAAPGCPRELRPDSCHPGPFRASPW